MQKSIPYVLALFAFCGAFLISISGRNEAGPPRMATHASGAMEALEFWSRSRAYPYPDVPPEKYYAAFQFNKRRFSKEPRMFAAAGSGWEYIGPENLSGRMISVGLNPLNPNTIYAGSASGGLWRSHSGGVAGDWARIPTGYPVLGVGAIAISPSDSGVIYIGTGEVYRYQGSAGGLVVRTTRGSAGMGILKTTDGGATWTKSLDWSYNQQRGVQSIKINPLNPNTVWAATSDGIYKSNDAGGTWTEILLIFMCQDIVIHPTDTNRVMISTGNLDISPGIFRTTDGGTNWDQVNPISFTGKTLLDSPPSFPEIVLASIADSTTGVGSLWKTTDFGSTWTQLITSATHNIFGVQGWYSHYVAVYPSDPNIVFHASVGARKSSNGGTTFAGVSGLYSDNHDFAYDPSDPNILYSANDDGIYRSTNFGASFVHVSDGLGTGQLYNGFSSSSTDSLIALGQSQDHIPGYLYQGAGTWASSAADESGWTAINPSNDSIMYAMNRFGGTILKSTNRGATFSGSSGFSTNGAWNTPVIIAPSNPSTIYVGKTKIFKSTNASATWSATNGNLELDGNPAISIAISATSADTLYVGMAPYAASAHIFRTTNGGSSWTNVTGTLPDRYPLDLAVDPVNSRIVYAAFGGYGTGHVFKSSNAGAAWTDISGALPDIPATALLVDPQNSGTVYVGTDIGVYVSTDGGGSWNSFNEGLVDAVLVSDLSMTASNRTLRVATHGNGVFQRRMPGQFPWISSVSPAGGESWEIGSVHAITWDQALIPSVRLDYSTNNGATWNLIAASVAYTPAGYAWTVPPVLSAAARVRVRSTADTALSAQSTGAFTIFINGSIVELHDSWNLISLPVAVADHSLGALFPGAVSEAFTFLSSYGASDSIAEGSGYWIKYAADAIIPFSGTPIVSDTLSVHKGWNLIGSLTDPVGAAGILSDPPGLVSSLYYGYEGSYSMADSIRPGFGYWVKCLASGSLIRSSGALLKTGGDEPTSLLREMSSITVTAADGLTETLYFGRRRSELPAQLFEAPPLPPAGGFDARFASNRIAEFFDGGVGEAPIVLTSCTYPVTLSWKIGADQTPVALRTGTESIPMLGSGSVSVARAGTPLGLSPAPNAEAVMIPEAFALRQNFPNPFNPSTEIRYDIPAASAVRLIVYSLLGEELSRLVDEPKAAGSYAVRWNAESLPSGVYLVRLTAENKSSTLKMLLMK